MTTDGPAELRRLAGDFELTKSECWNESDTTSMWALSVAWGVERAQAAADREDCAKFAGQNELLIKATGTETFSAALQRISVCAADRAALAQARALLPEELVECVWNGRGYERCGCANVDKDNHCMYCLYPPWAHDLAATLGGAR